MIRFLLRRLLIFPVILILVNFAAFSFSQLAIQYHQRQNPFGSLMGEPQPLLAQYQTYLEHVLQGDFGTVPDVAQTPVGKAVWQAGLNSLGLLLIAFVVSTVLGLAIGLNSVKTDPPRSAPWLTPFTAAGMALPSFYLGAVFISLVLYSSFLRQPGSGGILPAVGYGWDLHLVLPVLALMIRPTLQIAQMSSEMLADELSKQYIVAARSRGNSWQSAQRKHALRNVIAPITLTIAGSFRLLIAELVLVEWLFGWPGLGHLLTQTLIPPNIAVVGHISGAEAVFLSPELLTAILVIFAALFILADSVSAVLIRLADPRLRGGETDASHV